MRFMVIVKASKNSEAGVMPSEQLLAEMGKFNEELTKAGVMLAGEGLQASSKGARVRFSRGRPTVSDGPFTEAKELVAGFWLVGNERNGFLPQTERRYDSVVVGVLDEHRGRWPPEQPAEKASCKWPHGACFSCVGGKGKTQACQRVEPHNPQTQRRQRTHNRRHDGDMMNKIRFDLPVDAARFQNRRDQPDRVQAAAPPLNRMQGKSFTDDLVAAFAHVGGDVNLITGPFRCARHRQTVRRKIPVFRDEVDNFPWHQT